MFGEEAYDFKLLMDMLRGTAMIATFFLMLGTILLLTGGVIFGIVYLLFPGVLSETAQPESTVPSGFEKVQCPTCRGRGQIVIPPETNKEPDTGKKNA